MVCEITTGRATSWKVLLTGPTERESAALRHRVHEGELVSLKKNTSLQLCTGVIAGSIYAFEKPNEGVLDDRNETA